jgi:ABC-type tungstate transport system permease subunit
MAVNIQGADLYVANFFIDSSDWMENDDQKKQRILNVADRSLADKYKDLIIPEDAVYEFAATLAIVYNDTNRMQQHGIAGFSVTGVGSFTFKENNVKSAAGQATSDFITDDVRKIIEKANEGIKLNGRIIKDVIM